MPYDIHSASGIYQATISEIISGLQGAANSQDDIIVWGSSKERLNQRTIAIRKGGLKLRKSKCQFNMKEPVFLGHKVSHRGVEADTQKIAPIIDMPNPTNKKELQRFLGMINYLGKFIPNFSNETVPLRQYLAKDVMWSFDQPQTDAIKRS